jgi:hypothetical protein
LIPVGGSDPALFSLACLQLLGGLLLALALHLVMAGGRPKRGADGVAAADEGSPPLSEEANLIVAAITKQFEELASKFEELKEEFRSKLSEKDRQVDCLQDEVEGLKSKVSILEDRIDDADAYERRDTIIFSGKSVPLVSDEENCAAIVGSIMKEKLKLVMAPSDISTAHRLGRRPATQQPDGRNIVVKLCRRDLKEDILHACRNLRPTDLYVNESLTRNRSTILYVLRSAKKRFPEKISGCGSVDGKVRVFVKSPNPDAPGARNSRTFINTQDTLRKFCDDILGTPLTSFIENWP